MARSRFTVLASLLAIPFAIAAWTLLAQSREAAPLSVTAKPGEWRYLNADPLSTRYSPLDQINRDNFKNLKIAWRWKPAIGPAPSSLGGTAQGNGDPDLAIYKSEATPIMANGVLYKSAGGQRVVAADRCRDGPAIVAVERHRRKRPRPQSAAAQCRPRCRLLDGRERGADFRHHDRLLSRRLDAKTGMPVPTFGANGAVDLMKELNVDFDHVSRIGNSSPPMVYRDTVIIPPALEEGFVPSSMRNTPGYVMAFDARTGKQKWAFHTVPKNGETGAETWERTPTPIPATPACGRRSRSIPNSAMPICPWKRRPTTTMAVIASAAICSPIRSSPSISKPADGSGTTRSRITTSGTTISASAPALVDMTVAGRPVKALVQLTKQGYAYVLDRVTGSPSGRSKNAQHRRATFPANGVADAAASDQARSLRISRLSENDLIDFTPALRAEAIRIASQYRRGPLFTPPSEIKPDGTKGSWYNPGGTGGSLWQSGGFDPETKYFYIPSKTGPAIVTVRKDPKSRPRFSRGPGADLSVAGLPILKPPYSRITALDLNTGEYAWMVPLGTTPQRISQNPALAGMNLPNTGGINLHATLLVTKTLLIAGEGWGGEPVDPRLRQEDRRHFGRAANPRSDGKHADDLHGQRQAIHRLHCRHAHATRGTHRPGALNAPAWQAFRPFTALPSASNLGHPLSTLPLRPHNDTMMEGADMDPIRRDVLADGAAVGGSSSGAASVCRSADRARRHDQVL